MSNLACHTDRMNIESVIYKSIIPDGQPQELAAILDEIVATIKQFVIIGDDEAIALAVWAVHTYLFRQRDAVAYVAIQSPEKRCGKTTLLSVLAGLADKALVASNVSVGALFRAIDEAGPTLLIDEADTFLGHNSVMRGILNCGNTRRTAFVLRIAERKHRKRAADPGPVEGQSNVVRYSCWCPKVVAMIGNVPETLADRSIVINMVRKLVSEECAPLSEFNPEPIQRKCARWALDNTKAVHDYPRQELRMVSDRASDTYEPLMVLARLAGGDWPDQLTKAATKLCSHENTEAESASLLLDTMAVFIVMGAKRILSRTLAAQLKGKSGWAVYDITSRQEVSELGVARILRRYGIKPVNVRVGEEVSKGYKWEQFTGALERYVPKSDIAAKINDLKQMHELAMEAKRDADAKRAAEEAARAQEDAAEEAAEEAEEEEEEDEEDEAEEKAGAELNAMSISEAEAEKLARSVASGIEGLLEPRAKGGAAGQELAAPEVAAQEPKQHAPARPRQEPPKPAWSLADIG